MPRVLVKHADDRFGRVVVIDRALHGLGAEHLRALLGVPADATLAVFDEFVLVDDPCDLPAGELRFAYS